MFNIVQLQLQLVYQYKSLRFNFIHQIAIGRIILRQKSLKI